MTLMNKVYWLNARVAKDVAPRYRSVLRQRRWAQLRVARRIVSGIDCSVPGRKAVRRMTISWATLGATVLLLSARMAAATEITWPSFQWSEPNNAPVIMALK